MSVQVKVEDLENAFKGLSPYSKNRTKATDKDRGDVYMAGRPEQGSTGSKLPVHANLFEIKLAPSTTLYRYDVQVARTVSGFNGNLKHIIISNLGVNEHEKGHRRFLCYEAFRVMSGDFPAVFQNPFAMVYDRRKTLFTLQPVIFPVDSPEKFVATVQVPGDEEDLDNPDKNVNLLIQVSKPVEDAPIVRVEDLAMQLIDKNVNKRDRTVLQILELASSQFLFLDGSYLIQGRNFYRRDSQKDLGGGRILREGFCKSVKAIQGGEGHPVLAMQIDMKKSPFFEQLPLPQSVHKLLGKRNPRHGHPYDEKTVDYLRRCYKGVVVQVSHRDPARNFEISSITREPASALYFTSTDTNGKTVKMSVLDYYSKNYKPIQYPFLPCVVEVVRGKPGSVKPETNTRLFPMELCYVLPNQKVTLIQQTEENVQKMIREAAVPAVRRQAEIYHARVLMNHDNCLKSLGMDLAHRMTNVEARVLPKPMIQYNGAQSEPNSREGRWTMDRGRFIQPAKITSHALVAIKEGNFDTNILGGFKEAFYKSARMHGMDLGENKYEGFLTRDQLQAFFNEKQKTGGIDFIIFFVPTIKDENLKYTIKYLEATYHVITQCIRIENVQKVAMGKRMVLEQIMQKANTKLGGMNWDIVKNNPVYKKWLNDEVMYMGVDVSHPPPMSTSQIRQGKIPKQPSVVGMSATTRAKTLQLTGDFWLQDARQELIRPMQDMVVGFLQRYKKEHNGQLPTKIIVFRDGLCDGQYSAMLSDEVPAIRRACESLGAKVDITFSVVQKRHMTRLFRAQHVKDTLNAVDQSVPPGTLVDHTVVHPTDYEFFLASHSTLQGTVKPVKYVVLLDENGFERDDFQQVAYMMSHAHSVVNRSVSLPAPLYAAHELAKRGFKLYKTIEGAEDDSSSGISSGTDSSGRGSSEGASSNTGSVKDWSEITQHLRIKDTDFEPNSKFMANTAYWA